MTGRAQATELVRDKGSLESIIADHAVPGNLDRLKAFRTRVTRLWRRTLLARSQKHRLTATRMYSLETRWLPQPRVLHPYPEQRFTASHPR